MAIYMKFGTVKGDIDTPQYKDWIMVHSFQFGSGRGIGSATGSGSSRQGSHASVSEVTISKQLDPASLPMWRDGLDGKLNTTTEFSFTLADQDNSEYLHVTLFDTGVSGWSISSGGDRPSESVSLNFAKVELKNTATDVGNTTKTPLATSYDLTKQTAG